VPRTFAYVRVSTACQTTENQVREIEEYQRFRPLAVAGDPILEHREALKSFTMKHPPATKTCPEFASKTMRGNPRS
jgi:hypothetical protein